MTKMKFLNRLSLGVLLFVIALNVHAVDRINVFVSILPQQYFVQQVGGEYVDVHVMVGAGQNPATYEPTSQQMAALANADLYFSIGVPFEKLWLGKIRQNNRNLIVVECCESFADLEGHVHDENSELDPHIWTSPEKVVQIIKLIRTSLSEIDNDNKDKFKDYTDKFINKLEELDSYISARLSNIKQRHFIVSHPSWGYFAHDYNLIQIPIEQNGKEIQARSMARLIKLAKEKNIKAVFVQKQFNSKAAKTIAREINGKVFEVDPLAYDYIENMNDVANKIAIGLSDE